MELELYSYHSRNQEHEGANIQVYHETQDSNFPDAETNFSRKVLFEPIKKYDFFTIRERKCTHNKKKKKGKKKEKPPNLMDIINSEMGSIVVPVSNNVIEIIEDRKNHIRDLIDLFTRDHRTIQRRQSYFSLKHRFQNSQTIHLSRVFPDISENTAQDFTAVEYIAPKFFEDLVSEYNNEGETCTKFLDVELKNIKFKHHHKYSLESILCLKLIEQFEEYQNLQQTIKDLSRDIKVKRDTKNNLKRELLKVSPSKKEELRFDVTVRKYVGQFLDLKEKYREIFKEHKAAMHKILSLWSDIEMIREKNESRDTPYDVYIKRYKLSEDELEKEWNELYEIEFSDMIDKLEYEYVSKYIDYREAKNEYENSSKKKLNKPRMNVDEEKLKTEVEQLVNSFILREKIDLSLVRVERLVNELKNIRNVYHFEVYVDKVFVCDTEEYECDDETLNANFFQSFSVEILSKNKNLTIVLFENYEKVANVDVDLSKVKNVNANDDNTVVEFQYNNHVDPTSKIVGSSCSIKDIAAANKVRLKSSNLFKGNLVTSCQVLVRIGWSDIRNQMDTIKSSLGIGQKLKRLMNGVDKPNIDVLTDLIGEIYGKDISNETNMIKTIQRLCKLHVICKANDTFHTDENSPGHIRIKLLHLRNIGGFADVENKIIPIHSSQISTEQLDCLQNTKKKDIDIDYLKSKETDMDPIELQRFIATKYMQKLNKTVMKSLNEHLMVKTRKDVVREYQNFSLRALFSRQSNAASLAPISSNTKQQILAESLNKEHEIQISVLRAFNLFDRSSGLIDDSENDIDTIAGFKVRPLRPFVKVGYRGVCAQTGTAMGCHPTWNHTLKICTRLNPLSNIHINIYDECKENISDDTEDQSNRTLHYRYCTKWLGTVQVPLFTVLTLGTLRGTFEITTPPLLFGYETPQNKASTSLIPEVTQLMKKDISFIALHITSNLSHLGGFQAYNQPLPGTIEDDYIIKHLNTFVTDYVNMFPNRNISLTFIDSAGRNKCVTQFLQPIPMPSREHFPKNPKSCGSAMSKSSGFSRSSSSKSSGRKRDVDVEASGEKESVYSQGSWKGGDNVGKMINTGLRYVALIPTYEVSETDAVTLMGLELLKVLHGTALDHAILLASYFLYIGIRSWVAIGIGLPRGRSSFVIIQYDLTTRRYVLTSDETRGRSFLKSDGYLWFVCDATSGTRRELRDAGCPMKTVDYVFDNENVWVNMQSSQDCESVLFDFSKSSDWKPVFDKSIFVMKHPIVNDSNLYSPPSAVESLRKALETKIRGKVQKWRPHMKTIWNRYCSGLLRDALLFWEYWAFNPQENKPGLNQKLKQLMATYKTFGVPLNMPFLSTKSVVSAVKSTEVHAIDDPNVEFGLAVEVYAYPNNVLSVWVFLVSISRI